MSESTGPASLREQHQSLTRLGILRAARDVFATRGYGGASMKAIAANAGVAVQTLYDTFGSKAGIALGLADLLDADAGILDTMHTMRSLTEPREILALLAAVRRRIRERAGDIVRILRATAAAEPAMAATFAEGMRRRHAMLTGITARLAEQGALRPGLSADRAADIAAGLVADEVFEVLVEPRGWSFDEYEAWLAATLATALLA